MRNFRLLLFVALAVSFAGCSSKPPEKEYVPPPLVIAQSDGAVRIGWESEPGYVYTIYYQSSATADWKALKNAYRISGTGQMLTASDLVNPNRPPRRYRIIAQKTDDSR